jgi:tetratricopeptide (TPR) repeat protein
MAAAWKAFTAITLCAGGLAAQTPAESSWEQRIIIADQLIHQGNHAEAEEILLKAVAEADRVPPRGLRLATALHNLGYCYQDLGRAAKAEKLYLRAARIWEQAGSDCLIHLIICWNNLATLYMEAEQYGKAESLLRGPLTDRVEGLAPNHLQRGHFASILGQVYYTQGNYAEAEPLLRQALAIFESNLGPDHHGVAAALNNLGALHFSTGHLPEAWSEFERALGIYEKRATPEIPGLAKTLTSLATLAGIESRWEECEGFLDRALAAAEKTFGPVHPLVGEILWNRAAMLRKTQRKREAKEVERRAKEIFALWSLDNPFHHTIDVSEFPVRGPT